MSLVSDGKDMRVSLSQETILYSESPRQLESFLRIGLTRAGLEIGFLALTPEVRKGQGLDDPEASFTVTDFEMGKADRVDGREVKVITYRYGKKAPVKVSLWLDAKTLMPIRRVDESENFQNVDEFRKFVLDSTINAATFELPK